MTLYELQGEYELLLELAEDPDPEIDQQTILDTMEAIEGEIEVKADGYARVLRQLEHDAANLKAEEKRLYTRRNVIENNMKRMKAALQAAMETTGKRKFKTDLFLFNIQKNPPALVIDDPTRVTHDFMIPQDPKIDTKAIKDAIKEGFAFDWCHMEQTESLRIK